MVGSFDGVDGRPDTPVRREFDSRTLHPRDCETEKTVINWCSIRPCVTGAALTSGPRHLCPAEKSPTKSSPGSLAAF